MKKRILQFISLLAAGFIVMAPASAMAGSAIGQACEDNPGSVICKQSNNADNKTNNFINNIVNTLLFVLGTIAVIMIIVGGIRYTTSNGDQSQLSSAKNTILYSVVGLVVAIMAYAIVNFVIGMFL